MPFQNQTYFLSSPLLNIGLFHSTSSHFSYLITFYPHVMYINSKSTVCDNVYFIFSLFHFTTVLWIPENALKSRISYLEMLSVSLSVSSSPRYSCRICELHLLSVTEQTRYTLHWCQVAQVNDCSVTC